MIAKTVNSPAARGENFFWGQHHAGRASKKAPNSNGANARRRGIASPPALSASLRGRLRQHAHKRKNLAHPGMGHDERPAARAEPPAPVNRPTRLREVYLLCTRRAREKKLHEIGYLLLPKERRPSSHTLTVFTAPIFWASGSPLRQDAPKIFPPYVQSPAEIPARAKIGIRFEIRQVFHQHGR